MPDDPPPGPSDLSIRLIDEIRRRTWRVFPPLPQERRLIRGYNARFVTLYERTLLDSGYSHDENNL